MESTNQPQEITTNGNKDYFADDFVKDVRCHIFVSLEELYLGSVKKVALQRNKICMECVGGVNPLIYWCETCNKPGTIYNEVSGSELLNCTDCSKPSKRRYQKCKFCLGKNKIRERKIVDVNIERGMKDDDEIRVAGEGNRYPGMDTGDGIVIINEKQHDLFTRIGDDLIIHMDLNITESLVGFTKDIRTLDSRTISYKSKIDGIIRNDDIKCIPREGMPKLGNHNEKGNLYIHFHTKLPEENWLSQGQLLKLDSFLNSSEKPDHLEDFLPHSAAWKEIVKSDLNSVYANEKRKNSIKTLLLDDNLPTIQNIITNPDLRGSQEISTSTRNEIILTNQPTHDCLCS